MVAIDSLPGWGLGRSEVTDPAESVRQFHDGDVQVQRSAEFQQITVNAIKWRRVDVISRGENE